VGGGSQEGGADLVATLLGSSERKGGRVIITKKRTGVSRGVPPPESATRTWVGRAGPKLGGGRGGDTPPPQQKVNSRSGPGEMERTTKERKKGKKKKKANPPLGGGGEGPLTSYKRTFGLVGGDRKLSKPLPTVGNERLPWEPSRQTVLVEKKNCKKFLLRRPSKNRTRQPKVFSLRAHKEMGGLEKKNKTNR